MSKQRVHVIWICFALAGASVALFSSSVGAQPLSQCEDGIDNDGDGFIDYPEDPQCDAPGDDDELASGGGGGGGGPPPDSDDDGLNDAWETTYFGDPSAQGPGGDPDDDGFTNLEEHNAGTNPTDPASQPPPPPACSDGLDNDEDGLFDFPADPGCTAAGDTEERGALPCDDNAVPDYPQEPWECPSVSDHDLGPDVRFVIDPFQGGDDVDLDDGACTNVNGKCTLRGAIQQLNHLGLSQGFWSPNPFRITYPPGGPYNVGIATSAIGPLGSIQVPMVIDGSMNGDCMGPVNLFLYDEDAPNGQGSGLALADGADGSTICNVGFGAFAQAAVSATGASGVQFINNWVGLDIGGAPAPPGGDGLRIQESSDGEPWTIRDNVFAAADGWGIAFNGANHEAETRHIIERNIIGLRPDGQTGTDRGTEGIAGNRLGGIRIDSGSFDIGGMWPGESNTISGNKGSGFSPGIEVFGATAGGVSIQGNNIGLDQNGLGPVTTGNGGPGVVVGDVDQVLIGGILGEGNRFGWNADGILLRDGAAATCIDANVIGLDANEAIAPNGNGIKLASTSGPGNKIGDCAGANANIISGNAQHGITNSAPDTIVRHNRIGLKADGITPAGNLAAGIFWDGPGGIIGGKGENARNEISANGDVGGSFNDGIHVAPPGHGVVIQANYIGTDHTGTMDRGNQVSGIFIAGAQNVQIGGSSRAGLGNVISGNTVEIGAGMGSCSPLNPTIQGNIIGLAADGFSLLAAPNGGDVVGIDFTRITSATIGGNLPGLGNIISGNGGGAGIKLAAATPSCNGGPLDISILGNTIGLAQDGTTRGNGMNGIQITGLGDATLPGTGVRIGDATPLGGNVISGNGGRGIQLGLGGSSPAHSAVVVGNHIGVDATGTMARPNAVRGLWVGSGNEVAIGDGTPEGRNIISGNNGPGIYLEGNDASVHHNFIGVAADGVTPLPNNGEGVVISSGGQSNEIGGGAPQYGNVISGNAADGVLVAAGPTALNGIYSNAIGLGADRVTPVPNGGGGVSIFGAGTTVGDAVNGNDIWYNTNFGIHQGVPAVVFGNSMRGNGNGGSDGLSIGHGSPPPTPAILSAAWNGGQIQWTVDSQTAGPVNLYFYLSNGADAACSAASVAQGELFIGATGPVGGVVDHLAGGVLDVRGMNLPGFALTVVARDESGTDGMSSLSDCFQIGHEFVVDSLGDHSDEILGDDDCWASTPGCSLRAAIEEANQFPGDPTTIRFNVNGGAASVIQIMGSTLPTIEVPILIDGKSQYDHINQAPLICVRDGGAPQLVDGISTNFAGDQTVIDGLAVGYFTNGIYFGATDHATVRDSFIGGWEGTACGEGSGANGDGIVVSGSDNALIIGNVVSSNQRGGIDFRNGATNGKVYSNIIGLDRSQGIARSNGQTDSNVGGIEVSGGAITIGDLYGRGNVIAGNDMNTASGIILSNADGSSVAGNLIGTNRYQTVFLPNAGSGIELIGSDDVIVDSNVILGASLGIQLFDVGGDGTNSVSILANRIGISDVGTVGRPAYAGIYVNVDAGGVTIGQPGLGNVVWGSVDGPAIEFDGGSGHMVQGNWIGVRPDLGHDDAATTSSEGVVTETGTGGILIGGDMAAGEGNHIGGVAKGTRTFGIGPHYIRGNFVGGTMGGVNGGIEAFGFSDEIQGNWVGFDEAGAPWPLGGYGIRIPGGSVIVGGGGIGERNIVGNSPFFGGIVVTSGGVACIDGNWVGLDPDGDPAPNYQGVIIDPAASPGNLIGNCATTPSGNVISGNQNAGLLLFADQSVVYGNIVGLDSTGTEPRPNGEGIYIGGAQSIVGSPAPSDANTVSGNEGHGIAIGSDATNSAVRGNVVGGKPDGTCDMIGPVCPTGNDWNGIMFIGESTGLDIQQNTVIGNGGWGFYARAFLLPGGGTLIGDSYGLASDGQVVGNGHPGSSAPFGSGGVHLASGQWRLQGSTVVGNEGRGVHVESDAINPWIRTSRIGLTPTGEAAGNQGAGIYISGARDALIEDNIIGSNAGHGIEIYAPTDRDLNPAIEGNAIGIDGNLARGNGGNGIQLFGVTQATIGGSVVGDGNVISNNQDNGVAIFEGNDGTPDTALLVRANLIGVDATGQQAHGNLNNGVWAVNADAVQIGGTGGDKQVISGNAGSGIVLDGVNGISYIRGNHIGADVNGGGSNNGDLIRDGGELGNRIDGIQLFNSVVTVGGVLPLEANIISGNFVNGVYIHTDSFGGQIVGNIIGLSAGGTALPNGEDGIYSTGNYVIGGPTPAHGNIISANRWAGIRIYGAPASGTIIQNNFIGTGPGGVGLRGNEDEGITVFEAIVVIGGAGQGNIIANNGWQGIFLDASADGTILGNRIGIDAAGAPAGNGYEGITSHARVNIGGPAPGEGNIIGNNAFDGILLAGQNVGGSWVQGNWIGTDDVGTGGFGNGGSGIATSDAELVMIGGEGAGEGNIIVSNGAHGIDIRDWSGNTLHVAHCIDGNSIGIDAFGDRHGNAARGIRVHEQGVRIGGCTGTGEGGNIIADNAGGGLWLEQGDDAMVFNNRIGVDGDDQAAGNGQDSLNEAVYITDSRNVILGQAGRGNIIAGNAGWGVVFGGGVIHTGSVQGNWIGVTPGGQEMGNGNDGLLFHAGSGNALVGGHGPGEGNDIRHNAGAGVAVGVGNGDDTSEVRIIGNRIQDNAGGGIDLNNDGAIQPVDDDDVDGGGNLGQNAPTVSVGGVSDTGFDFVVDLDSVPGEFFEIDVYITPAPAQCGDLPAEGGFPIFNGVLATDGSGVEPQDGRGTFTASASWPTFISGGDGFVLTATATSIVGSTSEFSSCTAPLLPPSGCASAPAGLGCVFAWGKNANGQLGQGATYDKEVRPVPVFDTSLFTKVAAGARHSAAIDESGRLWTWGSDVYGELGNGPSTGNVLAPQQIMAGTTFVDVSAGRHHALAIDGNGHLWSWGRDDFGQLGDDAAKVNMHEPRPVDHGTRFVAISAGYEHSLAIDDAGNLWAWGATFAGQVGNGEPIGGGNDATTPVHIAAGSTFVDVAAGQQHSLAVDDAGTLWSWGANLYGGLGDGTLVAKNVPQAILVPETTFQAVAAGEMHSLALDTLGNVWGWGSNEQYQTGNGQRGPHPSYDEKTPEPILADAWFVDIAAGGQHSLAIDIEGDLWAWGHDLDGQAAAADGSTYLAFPAPVVRGPHAVAIAGGQFHSLAILRTQPADLLVNDSGDQGDANPGDGACDIGLTQSRVCTLRAAIEEANALPGTQSVGFDLPIGGRVIAPTSEHPLPAVIDPITIDGGAFPSYTLPNGQATVRLVGSGPPSGFNRGLDFQAGSGGSVVTSLGIEDFDQGLRINPGAGSGITVLGNDIGIIGCPGNGDPAGGLRPLPGSNRIGILMQSGGGLIQDNVISCNGQDGIHWVQGAGSIRGNIIGLARGDGAGHGNGGNGIRVFGGTPVIHDNVVGENVGAGIMIEGPSPINVHDNFIGTNSDGTMERGNGGPGIHILGSHGHTIVANHIAANIGEGITVERSDGNHLHGNLIGVAAATETPLPNGLHGVRITGGRDNVVGDPANGNLIAFNGGDGVHVETAAANTASTTRTALGNSIRGNAITGNDGLGIDLRASGDVAGTRTPNDPTDADTGPNGLLNAPVVAPLTAARDSISGDIMGAPNQALIIDAYANIECDGSGAGEGLDHLGQTTVVTDAAGRGTFILSGFPAIPDGDVVSLTATHPTQGTSEFSACGREAIVVNSADDEDDWDVTYASQNEAPIVHDGICDTGTGGTESRVCTLRAALQEAGRDVTFDTILFDIPGEGPHVIQPNPKLPVIMAPLSIDNRGGEPIVIDGSAMPLNDAIIDTRSGASGSTFAGLHLVGGPENGIQLFEVDGVSVFGNTIGQWPDGSVDGVDLVAINVYKSTNSHIGRPGEGNTLVDSGHAGVLLWFPESSNNIVQGNLIGTDAANTAGIGNGRIVDAPGVWIQESSGNIVGGLGAGEGNIISGNHQEGVRIEATPDDPTAENQVLGNFIGMGPSGGAPRGNGEHGVLIKDAPLTVVRGNVISANGASPSWDGVVADGSGSDLAVEVQIIDNRIGVDATGINPHGNARHGILVTGADGTVIRGNVIAANNAHGVMIQEASPSNGALATTIRGNLIGRTHVAQPEAFGNGLVDKNDGGILLYRNVQFTEIGGTAPGDGNVISGNGGDGIRLTGALTTDNRIAGNIIGLDATMTVAIGNHGLNNFGTGIAIADGARNTIGGVFPGDRNVIAGNSGHGVRIIANDADDTWIFGNIIGTNPAGVAGLENGYAGVMVHETTDESGPVERTRIGGAGPGEGNVIAFHDGHAVIVENGNIPTSVRGNSIFGHGAAALDEPTGAFTPELTSAVQGSLTVKGRVPSGIEGIHALDFFVSPTCTPGAEQGARYAGTLAIDPLELPLDPDNIGKRLFRFTSPIDVLPGHFVTATATDSAGHTGAYSSCVTVTQPAQACTLALAIQDENIHNGCGISTFGILGENVITQTADREQVFSFRAFAVAESDVPIPIDSTQPLHVVWTADGPDAGTEPDAGLMRGNVLDTGGVPGTYTIKATLQGTDAPHSASIQVVMQPGQLARVKVVPAMRTVTDASPDSSADALTFGTESSRSFRFTFLDKTGNALPTDGPNVCRPKLVLQGDAAQQGIGRLDSASNTFDPAGSGSTRIRVQCNELVYSEVIIHVTVAEIKKQVDATTNQVIAEKVEPTQAKEAVKDVATGQEVTTTSYSLGFKSVETQSKVELVLPPPAPSDGTVDPAGSAEDPVDGLTGGTIEFEQAADKVAINVDVQAGSETVFPEQVDPASLRRELDKAKLHKQAAVFLEVSGTLDGEDLPSHVSESDKQGGKKSLNDILGPSTFTFDLKCSYFTANGLDTQTVRLIEFDSTGNLVVQRNADGTPVLDANGEPKAVEIIGHRIGTKHSDDPGKCRHSFEVTVDQYSAFAIVGKALSSAPAPAAPSFGGGGGGGGPSAQAPDAPAKRIENTVADSIVSRIDLDFAGLTGQAGTIAAHGPDTPPPGAPALPASVRVVRYLEVHAEGGTVQSATFHVRIPAADVIDAGQAVLLHAKDGAWIAENPIPLSRDGDDYIGIASGSCCSIFAIGFDEDPPRLFGDLPSGTHKGTLQLGVDAFDNLGIDRVEFRVDGRLVAVHTGAPFEHPLHTPQFGNGEHLIRIIAYDVAGNSVTKQTFVTFDNPSSAASLIGGSFNAIKGLAPVAGALLLAGLVLIGFYAIMKRTGSAGEMERIRNIRLPYGPGDAPARRPAQRGRMTHIPAPTKPQRTVPLEDPRPSGRPPAPASKPQTGRPLREQE